MFTKMVATNVLINKLLCLRSQANVPNENDECIDTLNAINVLLMPFGWLRFDRRHDIHYVYVAWDNGEHRQRMAAMFAASYVWEYSVASHTFKCVKCRTSEIVPGTVWTHDGVQVVD